VAEAATALDTEIANAEQPLRLLIAGGGIGGLVLARGAYFVEQLRSSARGGVRLSLSPSVSISILTPLTLSAALAAGCHVTVFERDASAIRGEGKYRGPIQIQSNALAALQAIHAPTADAVMAAGCITGDRINGLVDGVSGQWYCKFDTFHPAVDNGLPVTRVISRVELQGILAEGLEAPLLRNNCRVLSFEDTKEGVSVTLDNGETVHGDVLVGADGAPRPDTRLAGLQTTDACLFAQASGPRSARRCSAPPSPTTATTRHVNDSHPTPPRALTPPPQCYTGIADFIPPDVDTVGYRVFLGNKQYFVSSDVGEGRQQWYAFHCEPAGGTDEEGSRKSRLLGLFGHWCDDVVDLIKNTPEADVLRRDIYDRAPIMTWSRGCVTLLGDSAHAMQPNLGQGGCMAIEDAYTLAAELKGAMAAAQGVPSKVALEAALSRYEAKRRLRVGTIHGMARMAAEMASTYKAYLGEGLGPLSFIEKLHIPHPGSASGKVVMQLAMPFVLDWVLGGNAELLAGRAVTLRSQDTVKPSLAGGMTEEAFQTYLTDDDALLRAADADWLLLPICTGGIACGESAPPLMLGEPQALAAAPLVVGRSVTTACSFNELVSAKHLEVSCSASGDYYITDLNSTNGTWLNRSRIRAGGRARIVPGDTITLGPKDSGVRFRVKLRKREEAAPVEQFAAFGSA